MYILVKIQKCNEWWNLFVRWPEDLNHFLPFLSIIFVVQFFFCFLLLHLETISHFFCLFMRWSFFFFSSFQLRMAHLSASCCLFSVALFWPIVMYVTHLSIESSRSVFIVVRSCYASFSVFLSHFVLFHLFEDITLFCYVHAFACTLIYARLVACLELSKQKYRRQKKKLNSNICGKIGTNEFGGISSQVPRPMNWTYSSGCRSFMPRLRR